MRPEYNTSGVDELELQLRNASSVIEYEEKFVQRYPLCHLVWLYYAKWLCRSDSEKARLLLREKAETLRSLELWKALVDLEQSANIGIAGSVVQSAASRVPLSSAALDLYGTLKSAVDNVGFDPRSLWLWDLFFQYFTALHNKAVRSLAAASSESSNNWTTIPPVSSTAPLGQLVPSGKAYHELQSGGAGNSGMGGKDDLSRFFTTEDINCGRHLGRGIDQALLKHPFADKNMTSDATKMINDVDPAALRSKSASGDLNIKVFQTYLRKMAITPLIGFNSKMMKGLYQSVEDHSKIDSAFSAIQQAQVFLTELYPSHIFTRISDPLTPEMDLYNLPAWLKILEKEKSDFWNIRQCDESHWSDRLDFFITCAKINCQHIPHVQFEEAQCKFLRGQLTAGLQILQDLTEKYNSSPSEYGDPLLIALADAWELFGTHDSEKGSALLIEHMRKKITTESNPSISPQVLFHSLIKRGRIIGKSGWRLLVDELILDEKLNRSFTESIGLAIVSAELLSLGGRSHRAMDLINRFQLKWPNSAAFTLLGSQQLTDLPGRVSYEKAVTAIQKMSGTPRQPPRNNTGDSTAIFVDGSANAVLVEQWYSHEYHFGLDLTTLRRSFNLLRCRNEIPKSGLQLMTNLGETSFESYRKFSMNLTIGLSSSLIPTEKIVENTDANEGGGNGSMVVRPDQLASLFRMGQRMQQLLEIVEGLNGGVNRRGSGTESSGNIGDDDSGDRRAKELLNAISSAVEKAKNEHSLSLVQIDRIKVILSDPLTTDAIRRWCATRTKHKRYTN